MTKFSEKDEIQDSRELDVTITLDGDEGVISAGGNGRNGNAIFRDTDGKGRVSIAGGETLITAQDASEKKVLVVFDTGVTAVWIGTHKEDGGKKAGVLALR